MEMPRRHRSAGGIVRGGWWLLIPAVLAGCASGGGRAMVSDPGPQAGTPAMVAEDAQPRTDNVAGGIPAPRRLADHRDGQVRHQEVAAAQMHAHRPGDPLALQVLTGPGSVYQPFPPGTAHSQVIGQAEEANAFTIHAIPSARSGDRPLAAVGPVIVDGHPGAIVETCLSVQTEPGATATFIAPHLGSFAHGGRSITVQAGPDGVARIQFKVGIDGGDYPVVAASPARTGLVEFMVQARSTVPRPPAPSLDHP